MSNSPTLPPITGLQRKLTPQPALTVESDARLQSALAASARAEASLNGLFRSIQHLGNGVGGAREANESLTQELEALRDMLGAAHEQHTAFKQKAALLEQALDRSRKDAETERAFLLEEQDKFIVMLMNEQEAELGRRDADLGTLRGRVAELERREPAASTSVMVTLPPTRPERSSPAWPTPTAAPLTDVEREERAELERTARKLAEDRERARTTVQRLQAQRDEAQSAVSRVSKERDSALEQVHRLKSELGGPRISSRPPSAEARRDSLAFRSPSQPHDLLTLDGLEVDPQLSRPTSASRPSIPVPSASQPALTAASNSLPTVPVPSSGKPAPVISSVLSPPRSSPLHAPLSSRLSPVPSRLTPPPAPPEELRRALTNPPVSATSSSRPALKQKPDPSTRPLVGYSMSGQVEAEHLEGVRLSSKPLPDKR